MAQTAPRILVIIVTFNRKEYILKLLRSLNDMDYPEKATDILIVDNASDDGTVEAVTENFSEIEIICNSENMGGSGGFNAGLKWAFAQPEKTYDYIWLLDNDVRVHSRALSELVDLLEKEKTAGIAGSVMMQLDYPWRINEIGASLNYRKGELILHYHNREIQKWKGIEIEALLSSDVPKIESVCSKSFFDVEYVAAASLLVRTTVAREAGAWMDFFIHYDDVEWCLRIAKTGNRILASTKSVIWHMSAAAKIPTWVLYYDNRNVLFLLQKHASEKKTVRKVYHRILLKGLFYALIGKKELGWLHFDAVDDFNRNRMGKKNINCSLSYAGKNGINTIMSDKSIKHVLVSWAIDSEDSWINKTISQFIKNRPDLYIDVLYVNHLPDFRIPGSHYIRMPASKLLRLFRCFYLRNKYDLVIQSDYLPRICLSWLGKKILFINDEGFYLRAALNLHELFPFITGIVKRWTKIRITQKSRIKFKGI